MVKKLTFILAALFNVLFAQEEIRQARLDQNEAMACGDIEKTASFWTDDITLRRGLGQAVIGKEAYKALLDPSSPIIYVREPDTIEMSPHFPLAYESGTWTASRNGALFISGKYSAQWAKIEDRWLIQSELFVALICHEEPCPLKN